MAVLSRAWRLVGAGALGIVLGAGFGVSAASADTSGGNGCVEPERSVFAFQRVDSHTYQVSLREAGTVTCTAVTFNVGSYVIPDTWDRNGWNPTALPQTEFDYTTLTFPAGGTEAVTASVGVPACGPYQTDLYIGVRLTTLDWPSPMGTNRILGAMRDQEACASPTPTPSATTPEAATATPSAAQSTTPEQTSATAPAAVAPTTATSTRAPASGSVLPTEATRAATPASRRPGTAVLGTSSGTLPRTGSGSVPLLLLAVTLLVLGVVLLTGLPRTATANRRH